MEPYGVHRHATACTRTPMTQDVVRRPHGHMHVRGNHASSDGGAKRPRLAQTQCRCPGDVGSGSGLLSLPTLLSAVQFHLTFSCRLQSLPSSRRPRPSASSAAPSGPKSPHRHRCRRPSCLWLRPAASLVRCGSESGGAVHQGVRTFLVDDVLLRLVSTVAGALDRLCGGDTGRECVSVGGLADLAREYHRALALQDFGEGTHRTLHLESGLLEFC